MTKNRFILIMQSIAFVIFVIPLTIVIGMIISSYLFFFNNLEVFKEGYDDMKYQWKTSTWFN